MKPPGAIRLHVEPVTLALANEYVALVHRHHGPSPNFTSSFACAAICDNATIRGVAIAGLPIASNRLRDGLRTLEVARLATDGTPNACSILYAACARAARALGYSRIITYILDSESGSSVKAAGWNQDEGEFGNQSWANHTARPGTGSNYGPKGRWSLRLAGLDRPPPVLPTEVEAMRQPNLRLKLWTET